uniref:Uncharacterized protein n=2 Tax=Oryza sativa subsp. japonica TaxID=39947 RepID=Q69W16_ORYSJ|nr:hypothetical protein [Oryza sativa Japonica Group]BAD30393.1 hypothetical protein [Oryza sativa Japonica Group]
MAREQKRRPAAELAVWGGSLELKESLEDIDERIWAGSSPTSGNGGADGVAARQTRRLGGTARRWRGRESKEGREGLRWRRLAERRRTVANATPRRALRGRRGHGVERLGVGAAFLAVATKEAGAKRRSAGDSGVFVGDAKAATTWMHWAAKAVDRAAEIEPREREEQRRLARGELALGQGGGGELTAAVSGSAFERKRTVGPAVPPVSSSSYLSPADPNRHSRPRRRKIRRPPAPELASNDVGTIPSTAAPPLPSAPHCAVALPGTAVAVRTPSTAPLRQSTAATPLPPPPRATFAFSRLHPLPAGERRLARPCFCLQRLRRVVPHPGIHSVLPFHPRSTIPTVHRATAAFRHLQSRATTAPVAAALRYHRHRHRRSSPHPGPYSVSPPCPWNAAAAFTISFRRQPPPCGRLAVAVLGENPHRPFSFFSSSAAPRARCRDAPLSPAVVWPHAAARYRSAEPVSCRARALAAPPRGRPIGFGPIWAIHVVDAHPRPRVDLVHRAPPLCAADVRGPPVGAGFPLLTRRIQARVGVMERGGPCDGLCRFRIHLGTRGDCPLPAGDGGET